MHPLESELENTTKKRKRGAAPRAEILFNGQTVF